MPENVDDIDEKTKNNNFDTEGTREMKNNNNLVTSASGEETMLRYMPPTHVTPEDFGDMEPAEVLELVTGRVSRERAKRELVDRVAKGAVGIKDPAVVVNWTNGRVWIEGVQGIHRRRHPERTMSVEEFQALTPAELAEIVDRFSDKRRLVDLVFVELVRKGMPMTDVDVVYVTNGRVLIGDLTNKTYRHKQEQVILTTGVEFS